MLLERQHQVTPLPLAQLLVSKEVSQVLELGHNDIGQFFTTGMTWTLMTMSSTAMRSNWRKVVEGKGLASS